MTARGKLDSSFGHGGIARLPHRGILALPDAVTVQPDGRIMVAGEEGFGQETAPAPCGYCDFLTLGHLTPEGQPDRAFGAAGVVHTRLELAPSAGELGLALQRDGRIVVAAGIGRADSRKRSFLLVRLSKDGALDPKLNGRGYAATDMRSAIRDDDWATAVAIAPDGRYVLAGRSARDELEGGDTSGRIQFRVALARFLP